MTFRTLALCLVTFSLAAGCTNEPEGALSREEARAMGGGSADGARDLCEVYGWYGDGAYCDEFCPRRDPDCEAACEVDADCPPIFCGDGDCAAVLCEAGACAVTGACTAQLRWLQKDAYVSAAGRSRPFWPPHTTMQLVVECGGEVVREAEAANHGTTVDAVDAEGTPILVEVYAEEVSGSRAELTALADAFEGCECGTTFLSMDELEDGLVQELVGELAGYAQEHLICSEDIGGTDAIVSALSMGDVDFVLANIGACTWASGASWEDGLDDALAAVAAATSETLADYHVCNNDALLQAELFARFRDEGVVSACEGSSSLCAGPAWLYDPAE
ncbi:MAG: hypothetical protein SangKO_013510 [Sandaracinaceae bacterium]